MLCPFLQHFITSNSGNNNLGATLAIAPPGLAQATLDTLRIAISTSKIELFNTQSSIPVTELGLQVASLLLPFISVAADTAFLQSDNNNNGSTSNQLITLAMSCLEDLINRPHQPQLKQKILAQVLPAVATLCRSWYHSGTSVINTTAATLNSDLLGAFTRLSTQTLQHSFAFAVSNCEVASGVQEVLREITNLAAAAAAAASVPSLGGPGGVGAISSHVRVLAATEAWHAVLTYMEDLEASNWNEDTSLDTDPRFNGIDMNGQKNNLSAEKQLSSFYKQGILHFSHLLLSIIFTESSHHSQNQQNRLLNPPLPPFLVQNLDTTTGSGAALEDWIAAVGDNNEDLQTEVPQDNVDVDDADSDSEDDVLSSLSEAHVFAQQAEYFIAHAMSSYNKDLIPVLFTQLAPAMTAAAQARQQNDLGLAYLCNFRAEFALKLVARCAPHLPTLNLTNVHKYPDCVSALEKEEEGVSSLSGGHVLHLIQALIHFGGEQLNIVRSTEAQQAQQHERILLASVLDTLVTLYRTLSPLMTTWLPQIMLTKAGAESDVQILVSQLVRGVVNFVVGGIECSVSLGSIKSLNKLDINGGSSGFKKVAIAASQTLLSVTSIALSSGMKPPVVLLLNIISTPAFGSLVVMVAAVVQDQNNSLPRAALRSLFVSLSDLALRSWGSALQASTVDINERKAALSAVTAPLLQIILSVAQPAQLPPGSSPAVPQFSLAVLLGTDIVESYLGSPKVVRVAVFEVFAQPMMIEVMTFLKTWKDRNNNGVKSKLGTTLLGFISSCLRAFPAELGTSSIGELLSALVAAFSTPIAKNSTTASDFNTYNGDSTINTTVEAYLDADVALLSIITSALSQGGSKHAVLVMPAMHFGLEIWDKAAICGVTHIKSQVLASLLTIMAQHWRSLGGGSGGGGKDGTMAATAAAEIQPPSALVEAILTHVSSFLSDAASTRAIPSASDVNVVLETLMDIQSRSKLFWKPYFSGWKDLTMESILSMLLTRMYTGAQESLIDTFYQLAAANWSHFLLSFLPSFAEKGLAGLGARGAELAAGFGTGDMEVWAFEKGVLTFINDALYWEKRV
jgi:hypothetical protein